MFYLKHEKPDENLEKRGMKKILNENCGGAKNLFNEYLEKQIKNFEIEKHTENCRACRDVSNESRKLTNLLKRAVQRESAPQSLVDSIKRGIRR
jgi:predicted anti-sigma-YlaC factor YlaD